MENSIERFNPPPSLSFDGNVSDNWKLWKEQFNIYLRATKTTDSDDKVALFLSCVGLEGIHLYNTLKLESKMATLDEVMAVFERHCIPPSTNNVILERFNFLKIRRRDGQTFDQYLAEMKNSAARCQFAEADNMIRDQIIFQLDNDTLRRTLLEIPDLTLDKTVEHCRMVESWAHTWTSLSAHSPGTSDSTNKSKSDPLSGSASALGRSVITTASPATVSMVAAVLDDLKELQDAHRNERLSLQSIAEDSDDEHGSDSSLSSVLSLTKDWIDAGETLQREGELRLSQRAQLQQKNRRKIANVETRAEESSSSTSSSSSMSDDSDIELLPPPPRPPPIVITIDEDSSESETEPDSKKVKKSVEENS